MINLIKKINGLTLLIAILAFLIGWQLGHKDLNLQWSQYRPNVKVENKEPPKEVRVDFKLFWDTWDLLSKQYLDKKAVDPNKMFYGAISGMVAAVGDPYTVFLPPEQQKASKEELGGSFDGVGIQLGFNKDKRLVVMSPLDGTPAQKAGIKANDIIVKIGDKDTTSVTLPEAVKLIRGPKGSEVSLTIFREGEEAPKEYKLVRDTIIVKTVTLSFKETPSGKKIGVIKLIRFGERTNDEWNEAVSQILSQAPQAVILDVRNNPGGFLEGAVYVASEFLDGGDVVLQENARGQRFPYKVNRVGKILKLPMVVLVNKGSASAAEIVAGALQDRRRAQIVGSQSFGKGTIQEAEDLPGGAGIHITTAKWLTPDGHWVNATDGLVPDIKVADDEENDKADEDKKDLQMEKALELLD